MSRKKTRKIKRKRKRLTRRRKLGLFPIHKIMRHLTPIVPILTSKSKKKKNQKKDEKKEKRKEDKKKTIEKMTSAKKRNK